MNKDIATTIINSVFGWLEAKYASPWMHIVLESAKALVFANLDALLSHVSADPKVSARLPH